VTSTYTPTPQSPARTALSALRAEVGKAVVGQDAAVTSLVIALICRGHVLLEGVPGTAKTLLVRCFAKALRIETKRVQFTPDLMPGDITGSLIYDSRTAQFTFREGPVFTNLMLADEINRTPPKTQAALLEAMEERQVSVDGTPRPLPEPVHRRRHPEPGGVRGHLPAARGAAGPVPDEDPDRPAGAERRDRGAQPARRRLRPARPGRRGAAAGGRSRRPPAGPPRARRGDGPPAGAGLHRRRGAGDPAVPLAAARGLPAWGDGHPAHRPGLGVVVGRDYVSPDDVKALAFPTLRHRVSLRPEAELEGVTTDSVIESILATVPVPR
jgi:MoxR-like ATPase